MLLGSRQRNAKVALRKANTSAVVECIVSSVKTDAQGAQKTTGMDSMLAWGSLQEDMQLYTATLEHQTAAPCQELQVTASVIKGNEIWHKILT